MPNYEVFISYAREDGLNSVYFPDLQVIDDILRTCPNEPLGINPVKSVLASWVAWLNKN